VSVLERWQGRSVAAEPFEVLPESRELELVRNIYTYIYGLCIYVCVSVCPFCVLRLLVCNIVCVICVSSLCVGTGGMQAVDALESELSASPTDRTLQQRLHNAQQKAAYVKKRWAEEQLSAEQVEWAMCEPPPSHPTQPTQTTHASNPHTLACTRAQLLRIA